MCWCNPNIRTPDCGKLECHPPEVPDRQKVRSTFKAESIAYRIVQMVAKQEDPVVAPEGYEDFLFVTPERLKDFILLVLEDVPLG